MEDLINKIFKSAKQVTLDKAKKDSIRGAVLAFMHEHPVQKAPSFWSIMFSARMRPAYITVSSLALVVVATGFVSARAGQALPGEPLYPVKVGLNERVMQVLAFSDEAKTKLNISLAETRLQEAVKLASEDKINKNNEAQISQRLAMQVDAVEKSIEKLNSEKKYDDAQKISVEFEASLKTHSVVLEKIMEKKGLSGGSAPVALMMTFEAPAEDAKVAAPAPESSEPDNSVSMLLENVNMRVQKTNSFTEISTNREIEDSGSSDSAKQRIAEKRLQSAEKSINELKNLIEEEKANIDDKTLLEVEDNLRLAQQNIDSGKAKLEGENKDYISAISLFNKANIIAKQSKNLIKVKKSLGIDIDIKIDTEGSVEQQIEEIRDMIGR